MFDITLIGKNRPNCVILIHGLFSHPGFWLRYLRFFRDSCLVLVSVDYNRLPYIDEYTLDEYLSSLGPKDQTITYFGFEKEALAKSCEALPIGSVAKFNKVGSALDFSPIWDNVNLYQFFCRCIAIN